MKRHLIAMSIIYKPYVNNPEHGLAAASGAASEPAALPSID